MNLVRYTYKIMALSLLLLVFLLLSVFAVHSFPELSTDSLRLKSFLMSRDPLLSEYSTKPLVFYNISIASIELFTKGTSSFSIQSPVKLLYISLFSQAFSLRQLPKLNYKYTTPLYFEVQFFPVLLGPQSNYLVICTTTEFLVYHLQGIGKKSDFRFEQVNIEYFYGSYGVSEVTLYNPYRNIIYPIANTDSKYLYLEKNFGIKGETEGNLCTVRAFFIPNGDYKEIIEVVIHNIKYLIPVVIKVRTQGLEIIKRLDFGIITAQAEYEFQVIGENSGKNPESIMKIVSTSRYVHLKKLAKIVQGYSEVPIVRLKFTPEHEGYFSSKIEIHTKDQIYSITCTGLVIYSLLKISSNYIAYSPSSVVFHSIQLLANISQAMPISQIVSSSPNIFPSKISELVPDKTIEISLELSVFSESTQFLTLISDFGNIQVPVFVRDPELKFGRYLEDKYFEIHGPVDLGSISHDRNVKLNLALTNLNPFEVTIEMIESIHLSKIEMPKTNIIPADTTIDYSISFKADRNLFNPVIFHTSIGTFFISIVLTIVSGTGKVKPIYFGDVPISTSKEQFIYFTNTFTIPVKILEISSKSKMLTFENIKEQVQPDKEQVIGKIKILYEKNEKIQMDWGKVLTYGDARMWNKMLHTWEEGEKVADLTVSTDVLGDITAPVFIGMKKPSLQIEFFPRFDYCAIGEICTSYFKVYNHLATTIVMQLLVVPEVFYSELRKFDCSKNYKNYEFTDDEFENLNIDLGSIVKREECIVKSSEEIGSIKYATEKKPRVFRDLGFSEQILEFLWPDDEEIKNKGLKDSTQSYFIGGKNFYVVPAKTSKVIGPVYFQPLVAGSQNLSFLLRNNYTVLEKVTVPAIAGNSKIAFMKRHLYYYIGKDYSLYKSSLRKELNKLVIDVTVEEIHRFRIRKDLFLFPIFIRVFELQNIGNLDVHIKKITFEGGLCELNGYILHDCANEILLKPQEFLNLQISYSPSYNTHSVQLWVFTNIDKLTFIIESKLPDDFALDTFLFSYGEETICVTIACSISFLLIFIKFTFFSGSLHFKILRTRNYSEVYPVRFFCKKYSQPIFLTREEEPLEEPAKVLENQEITEKVSVPVNKSRKKVKVRRNIVNTVIQKAEDLKGTKNITALPEIFATNQFLLNKKTKIHKSDDPAPNPKETTQSTETDEDFFIDSYKMTNVLFGGNTIRDSYELSELTQNSDPLDNILE